MDDVEVTLQLSNDREQKKELIDKLDALAEKLDSYEIANFRVLSPSETDELRRMPSHRVPPNRQ